MLLYNNKEFYPIGITEIYGKNQKKIYDRRERNKAYVYILLETTDEKGEE